MTDAQIIATYLSREKAANANPRGANHEAILADVASLAARDLADVRRVVLDSIFMGPN